MVKSCWTTHNAKDESLQSISANIAPAGNKTGSKNMKNGMQTLRIRNNEPVVVEEVNDSKVRATEKINELLENFMGINDSDLGEQCDLSWTSSEIVISSPSCSQKQFGSFCTSVAIRRLLIYSFVFKVGCPYPTRN